MKTTDLFKINRSSKRLNESMAKTFGKKLNLETFTLEQLEDARNRLRTQLHSVRSESGFNENLENETVLQAQFMLDAILSEIAERENIADSSVEEELSSKDRQLKLLTDLQSWAKKLEMTGENPGSFVNFVEDNLRQVIAWMKENIGPELADKRDEYINLLIQLRAMSQKMQGAEADSESIKSLAKQVNNQLNSVIQWISGEVLNQPAEDLSLEDDSFKNSINLSDKIEDILNLVKDKLRNEEEVVNAKTIRNVINRNMDEIAKILAPVGELNFELSRDAVKKNFDTIVDIIEDELMAHEISDRLDLMGYRKDGDSPKGDSRQGKLFPEAQKQGDTMNAFSEDGLGGREFNKELTSKYAMKIINDLKKKFGNPPINYAIPPKKKGMYTIYLDGPFGPDPSRNKEYDGEEGIWTPNNVGKVLAPYFNKFRENGWIFTQPIGNHFEGKWGFDLGVTENERPETEKNESRENTNNLKNLQEGEIQQASAIVTAKTMVDRVGRWIEELSGMENDTLLQLGDSIRDEMGQEKAKSFISTVAPAIQTALENLKTARETLASGVRTLTGEEQAAGMLGAEAEQEETPAEPDAMNTAPGAGEEAADEFTAAEPAAGGVEAAGREQRESIDRQSRLLKVLAG